MRAAGTGTGETGPMFDEQGRRFIASMPRESCPYGSCGEGTKGCRRPECIAHAAGVSDCPAPGSPRAAGETTEAKLAEIRAEIASLHDFASIADHPAMGWRVDRDVDGIMDDIRALLSAAPASGGPGVGREGQMAERLEKATRTLTRGVKTRDVGRCDDCGGNTSSGMDPLCYRCALKALQEVVAALRVAARPPRAPEGEENRDAIDPAREYQCRHFAAEHPTSMPADLLAEVDRLRGLLSTAPRAPEPETAQHAKLNAAYSERNAVVAALAHVGRSIGWRVGLATDPESPDWPVVYLDTPAGQVSWHLPADEAAALLDGLPHYEGAWDGHTTPEKYARLHRLSATPRAPEPEPDIVARLHRVRDVYARVGWQHVKPTHEHSADLELLWTLAKGTHPTHVLTPRAPDEAARELAAAVEHCGRVVDQREAALAHVARLTDALRFYANADHWQSPSRGFAAHYDPEPAPVHKDGGAIARAALAPAPELTPTETDR